MNTNVCMNMKKKGQYVSSLYFFICISIIQSSMCSLDGRIILHEISIFVQMNAKVFLHSVYPYESKYYVLHVHI